MATMSGTIVQSRQARCPYATEGTPACWFNALMRRHISGMRDRDM
jgi:hypothetical protein